MTKASATGRKALREGLRDPVKSSFRGKGTAAHALSETVPLQRTLASIHLAPGLSPPFHALPLTPSLPRPLSLAPRSEFLHPHQTSFAAGVPRYCWSFGCAQGL
jgi:hypothetical protein